MNYAESLHSSFIIRPYQMKGAKNMYSKVITFKLGLYGDCDQILAMYHTVCKFYHHRFNGYSVKLEQAARGCWIISVTASPILPPRMTEAVWINTVVLQLKKQLGRQHIYCNDGYCDFERV